MRCFAYLYLSTEAVQVVQFSHSVQAAHGKKPMCSLHWQSKSSSCFANCVLLGRDKQMKQRFIMPNGDWIILLVGIPAHLDAVQPLSERL